MEASTATSKRLASGTDFGTATPVYVVWEITLACNLKCAHCGSRAGKVRPGELTTQQCFDVIDSLHQLGTREISIIGGEAFLRKDWTDIIRRIAQYGMGCSMQTGAYNLTEERIVAAKEAGIKAVGVSIDGLEATHNAIRGRSQSFTHALHCLTLLKKHGIPSGVNTTITRLNQHELSELLDILVRHGITGWQIQLAVAMGNAADNSQKLLMQPYELIEFYEHLHALYHRALAHSVYIQPGNNIGYFGPYEHLWRGGDKRFFSGCSAGQTVMGIEADGRIKGCPSLPTTDYTGGNVKDMSLQDIWNHSHQIHFTRYRNAGELWGGCKDCYYRHSCMAGCSWTSHVLFGRRGNNPFCHYRALQLQKKGLKESIRKVKEAEGLPFDYGLYEVVVHNEQGEIVEVQSPRTAGIAATAIEPANQNTELRTAVPLRLCHNCHNYVYESSATCDFCQADVEAAAQTYQTHLRQARQILEEAQSLLG